MSADIPYVTDSDYRTPLPQSDTERRLWYLVIELYTHTCLESTSVVDSNVAAQQALPGQDFAAVVHVVSRLVTTAQPLEEATRQISGVAQELPSRGEHEADEESSHSNGVTTAPASVIRPDAPPRRAATTPPQEVRRAAQTVSLTSAGRAHGALPPPSFAPASRLSTSRTTSKSAGGAVAIAGGSPERDKCTAASAAAMLPPSRPAREQLQLCLRPLSEQLCTLSRRRRRIGASVLDVAIQHPHASLRRELVRLLLTYPYWCFDACAPVVVAAAMGDVSVVEQLLQDNRLDPNACCPLRTAVSHGQLAVLQVLLAHPRIVPNHGGAFLTAVARGDSAAMALFEAHADFDINRTVHPTGCTALTFVIHRLVAQHRAAAGTYGHQCGGNNNNNTNSGVVVSRDATTAAFWYAMLRHLLAHPTIDVNTGYAFTPLQSAVLAGSAVVVELLLLHPALRPNRITTAAHKLSNALHRLRYGTLTTSALCAAATPAISLAVQRRQVILFALLVRDRRVTLPVTLMAELEHNAADCGTAMYLEVVARYRRQWEFWRWSWRRRCLYAACVAITALALCNLCIVVLYRRVLGHVLFLLLAGYGLGTAIALGVCGYAQLQRVPPCPHLVSLFRPPCAAGRLAALADATEDAVEMIVVDTDDSPGEGGGPAPRVATADRAAQPEGLSLSSSSSPCGLNGVCCDLRRGVFARLFRYLMPRRAYHTRLLYLWLVVCCPPLLPPAMELLCLYHILRLYRACDPAEADAADMSGTVAATPTMAAPPYSVGSATRRTRLSFPVSHRDDSHPHGASGFARHGSISRGLLSALSTGGLVGGTLEGGGRAGNEDSIYRPSLLPSHSARLLASRGGGATSTLSTASATLQSLQSLPCASAAQFYVHTHPAPSRPHSASTAVGANNSSSNGGSIAAHSAEEEMLASLSALPVSASMKKRGTLGSSLPSLSGTLHYPAQQQYHASTSMMGSSFANNSSEVFGGAAVTGGCGGGGVPQRACFGPQPASGTQTHVPSISVRDASAATHAGGAASGRPGDFALQPLHDAPDLTLRSLLYLAYEALLPSRLVVCGLCIVVHLYLLLPDALASQAAAAGATPSGGEAGEEDGYVVLTLLASCGLVACVTASAAMLVMRLVLARHDTRARQDGESPPYCCMLPEEVPAMSMAFNRYL